MVRALHRTGAAKTCVPGQYIVVLPREECCIAVAAFAAARATCAPVHPHMIASRCGATKHRCGRAVDFPGPRNFPERLTTDRSNTPANSYQFLTNCARSWRLNQGALRRDQEAVGNDRQEDRTLVMAQVMTQALAQTNGKVPSLKAAVADLWRTLTNDLSGDYRPERHYMRGPGPKWRAKNAPASSSDGRGIGLAKASA
jgi:hypothetical protein